MFKELFLKKIAILMTFVIFFSIVIPGNLIQAAPEDYNTNDIAFINDLIDNYNLGWTKANEDGSESPTNWQVEWSNEASKRLVKLNLNNVSITGDVSDWNLPEKLELLDLNNTNITGDVSEWTLPDVLKELHLYKTKVEGDISGWNLPESLYYLDLYETKVEGDISEWVLPDSLEYLYLYKTNVKGDLKGWILPENLKDLSLSNTKVEGDISEWVLPADLKSLYLYNTKIKGDISGWVLPENLKELNLSDTLMDGDISEWVLPADLEWLILTNTKVGGDISEWSLSDSLIAVVLSNTNVKGDISGWVLPTSLKGLYLDSTSITGDISGWYTSNLEQIGLSELKIILPSISFQKSKISVPVPMKDKDGVSIPPIEGFEGGSYVNGEIIWEIPSKKQGEYTYDFSKMIEINNVNVEYAGTVKQPYTNPYALTASIDNDSGVSPSFITTTNVDYRLIIVKDVLGKEITKLSTTTKIIKNDVMSFEIKSDSDSLVFFINLKGLSELAKTNPNGKLVFDTNGIDYTIPFNVTNKIIGLDEYIKEKELELENLEIRLNLKKLTDKELEKNQTRYKIQFPTGELVSEFYDITIDLYDKAGEKININCNNFSKKITFSIPTEKTGNAAIVYNPKINRFAFIAAKNSSKFTEISTNHHSIYAIAKNNITFKDIKKGSWYYKDIINSANKAVVTGITYNLYDPEKTVARAEFVQMLTNVISLPAYDKNVSKYTDVTDGLCFDAIMRAKSAGLLDEIAPVENSNLTQSMFYPNQPITREEIAYIIAKVADFEEISQTKNSIDLNKKFQDYKKMNKKYDTAIQSIIRLKIMKGTSQTVFDFDGETTRAQVATVLMNMLSRFEMIE